jgi:hypothetical protein
LDETLYGPIAVALLHLPHRSRAGRGVITCAYSRAPHQALHSEGYPGQGLYHTALVFHVPIMRHIKLPDLVVLVVLLNSARHFSVASQVMT